jgi:hypothetical protein
MAPFKAFMAMALVLGQQAATAQPAQPCEPGYYWPQLGITDCVQCRPGTYSAVTV